ncbi:uncharacterized protein LOC108914886, partial [Anoplophora glabripennis]|uniref:uncharacterized protein LOC108914886 n=1 Tax=Anoplophora glabripennis TaxID=217634 RepID=UPI0008739273
MSLETSSVINRQRGNQPGNHSTINDSHGSLQTKLRSVFGEETDFATKKLEKYRIRKQKLLSQLAFLCRCREESVMPGFLKIKHHIQSHSAQRILHRASTCLLLERIRYTRRKLDQTERDLLEVHLRFTNKLDREAWDLVDKLTTEKASIRGEEATTKQKSKFEKLLNDQFPKQANLNKSRIVINLASIQLDEDTTEVLAKDVAEEVRADAAHVLRTAKPSKPNLNRREIQALKNLQKNESITILPADKGDATVVLNAVDYIAKVENLLLDPIYKNIRNNPVKKIEKKIAAAVRCSNIPKEVHRRTKDLVGRTEHHVKNAGVFIDRIRGIALQPGDILVSFDVTSLFTKIPVDEALEELHRRLVAEEKDESLMELMKNAALPFLYVLVERKPDGTLGHRVYRKPTHTDRYLNAQSHHHPAQKQGIINTLIHRARIISEPRHLAEELEHLRTALRGNGYKAGNIERAIRRRHTPIEKQ